MWANSRFITETYICHIKIWQRIKTLIKKQSKIAKNSWLSQMGKGELAYILPWPSVVFSSVCDGWTFRFTKELSQRDSFIRKSARLIHGTKNSRLSQMRKRELAHILPWRREFMAHKPQRYGQTSKQLIKKNFDWREMFPYPPEHPNQLHSQNKTISTLSPRFPRTYNTGIYPIENQE